MFYIVEREWVGPNRNAHVDYRTVEIHTRPLLDYSLKCPVQDWRYDTYNIAVTAHGEYSSIELAEDKIHELFGACREINIHASDYEPDEHNILFDDNDELVRAFKPGEYEPLSDEQVENWFGYTLHDEVHPDSSDAELQAILDRCEPEANEQGFTIIPNGLDVLKYYRTYLAY